MEIVEAVRKTIIANVASLPYFVIPKSRIVVNIHTLSRITRLIISQ